MITALFKHLWNNVVEVFDSLLCKLGLKRISLQPFFDKRYADIEAFAVANPEPLSPNIDPILRNQRGSGTFLLGGDIS